MDTMAIGNWRLRYDREATRQAYSLIARGAEQCVCNGCRNWVATREQVYPAEFLCLLEQLGVRADREAEVYHIPPRLDSGLHLYGGWFHFIGYVDAGPVEWAAAWKSAVVYPRFRIAFCANQDLVREVFKGHPLVQLEFQADVPWILNEPEAV